MDVRLFQLPRADAALSTAFFVPPSIRPTTQGSRFSQGGLANPPQAKQRSLLARLLGRELEAGSYSSGENSIPLKEVAKFPFAVVAIDVGIMPKDKIPRMVVSDGDKIYMYKVVGTKLEARVVHVGALQGPRLLDLPRGSGRRRRVRGARQPARLEERAQLLHPRRQGWQAPYPARTASRSSSSPWTSRATDTSRRSGRSASAGRSSSPRARPSRWPGRTASS